jgi:hypothetical protein
VPLYLVVQPSQATGDQEWGPAQLWRGTFATPGEAITAAAGSLKQESGVQLWAIDGTVITVGTTSTTHSYGATVS